MTSGNFYTSERGGMKMNFNGYSYNMDRTYSTHTTWRCIRSRWNKAERCLGRARSDGANVVLIQEHNHMADPQTAEALRLKSILYGKTSASRIPRRKISIPKNEFENNEGPEQEDNGNEENLDPSQGSDSTNEILQRMIVDSLSDPNQSKRRLSPRATSSAKRIKPDEESS